MFNYSIEDLLVGHYYRSHKRGLEGIIKFAEKRDNVYVGSGREAYLVTVRPEYISGQPLQNDFYATVCVEVSEYQEALCL